jgi:hypothetical protein
MTRRITILTVALLAIAASTKSAFASLHIWDWTPASTDGFGVGYNNDGGRINSIHAEFDSTSNSLQWLVNFGNVPGHSSWKTDGFTLALNNGPNPKGHEGELALLFFDASDATPVLTAYGYNGNNSVSTYFDGAARSGIQTPDLIGGTRSASPWVNQLTARTEADGSRTLGFEIDASAIIGHTPLHPGPGGLADWFGIGFDQGLGIWMHPFAALDTSYAGGYLTSWSFKEEGWLDGSGFTTVPEPGTIALFGLGAIGLIRKRRAQNA